MFLSRIYNRIPLLWKLILTTTLPFLLFFVMLVFFIPYQMDRISLHSVEESLKLAIDDVALHFDNQTAIRQPQQLNTQVVVYDTYLIPLRYYNYTYEVYPPDSVDKLEMRETPSREYRTTEDSAKNQEVAEYTKEIEIGGEKYFFQASKNIDYRNEIIRYSQLISIALFCIAVTLVFITSLISVKRNLRPLKAIAETAENITINNLSGRIPYEQRHDEIGRLVQAFNNMTQRLEEAVSKQNRFLSDVSHEIKTPVAVIKGYVNMIRRWGYSDPEVFNESVAAIDASVTDITDLINNLLLLDNLQNRRINADFKEVDIAELISKTAQTVRTLRPDRKVSVRLDRKRTAVCDEKLITQVIRILVDNGLKYSPDGSPLDLEVRIDSKKCVIRVCDSGEGIEEEEIPKVFGRFYRVEKSRSKETGGSGLGLSIAADIMNLHGGVILLSNREPHGLCAEIRFPVNPGRTNPDTNGAPSVPTTPDAESHTSNNQEFSLCRQKRNAAPPANRRNSGRTRFHSPSPRQSAQNEDSNSRDS